MSRAEARIASVKLPTPHLGFRASFLGEVVLARGGVGPNISAVYPPRHSSEPIVLELAVVRAGKTDLQCGGGSGFAAWNPR